MSYAEIEKKIFSLKNRKTPEEEIFHNKVYLFNKQTMENNIKKLRESIMQKTQFIQKHDFIQKETKYKQLNNNSELIKKSSHQNSYFSNEVKKLDPIESKQDYNNNNNNQDYLKNIDSNNNLNKEFTKKDDKNINISYNKYNKYDYQISSHIISDEISLKLQKEIFKKIHQLRKNRESSSYNRENSEKEASFGSNKSLSGRKKRNNPRFLTSLDNSNSQINNSDSYVKNSKKKLKKFLTKIEFKNKNNIDISGIKVNSDTIQNIKNKSIGTNTIYTNTDNFDNKLNFLKNNCKRYNIDIKEKLNESIIKITDDKEQEFLDCNFNKNQIKKKYSDVLKYDKIYRKDKKSVTLNSRTDSEFNMKEVEILSELNILEKKDQEKQKNNQIENNKDKNFFNPLMENINNESKNNFEQVKSKITGKKIRHSKKIGILQIKDKQIPSKQLINKKLNEIDVNQNLNYLENETYEKNNKLNNLPANRKLNSIVLPLKNISNNDENYNQYLFTNQDLIKNAEIYANLRVTQNVKKISNTSENLIAFKSPKEVLNENIQNNNENIKDNDDINKNIFNILINEGYGKKNSKEKELSIKESQEKLLNEENKLSNLINIKRKDSSFTSETSVNNQKLNEEKSKAINDNEYENDYLDLKEKNLNNNNSNLINISQLNNFKEGSFDFKKGDITNYLKMKITDRLALMGKGILKESYDAETEKIFQKIFTKNLENILEMKKYPIRASSTEKVNIHDERYDFGKKDYISKEVTDLKEKVYFLKATLDYIFPQYLIGKLKQTQIQQKNSKRKTSFNKITETNFNDFNYLLNDNHENEVQTQIAMKNTKYNLNKDSAFFLVENTDKDSSNGYSKNEFFFPNINNHDKNIYNNNINKLNNTNFKISDENFHQLKKKGCETNNFRNSTIMNTRFDMSSFNRTKLISSNTNSSLFNKFSNYKNLKTNNSMKNFTFNNTKEFNFHSHKISQNKEILAKNISIQKMNSFNVHEI